MTFSPVNRYGDSSAGERQYAVVEGDHVVSITGYLKQAPVEDPGSGRRWLLVEYADSQPFDPAIHYRLAPVARVDGDRVVREYPVILKSEDYQ